MQGVYFRKYTQKKASELGLRGWVENTPRNTVIGECEGPAAACKTMKLWLEKKGSPASRIDWAKFENTTEGKTLGEFTIVR